MSAHLPHLFFEYSRILATVYQALGQIELLFLGWQNVPEEVARLYATLQEGRVWLEARLRERRTQLEAALQEGRHWLDIMQMHLEPRRRAWVTPAQDENDDMMDWE